jgi:CopG family nickel-responsive transcriptional regulator
MLRPELNDFVRGPRRGPAAGNAAGRSTKKPDTMNTGRSISYITKGKNMSSPLVRFGVSLEQSLLTRFDTYLQIHDYNNRSEAIRDLIRNELIKQEWKDEEGGHEVAGAISFIYDHHKHDLMHNITSVQHDYQDIVISTQHVHLDHDNCFEIVALKGPPHRAQTLYNKLRATKGVKHASLAMSSTGKNI